MNRAEAEIRACLDRGHRELKPWDSLRRYFCCACGRSWLWTDAPPLASNHAGRVILAELEAASAAVA